MYSPWGPWEQSPLPFPGLMARTAYLGKRCVPGADSGGRGNALRELKSKECGYCRGYLGSSGVESLTGGLRHKMSTNLGL